MKKSLVTTYPEYHKKYLDMVEEENLIEALENSLQKVKSFFLSIPENKLEFRYQTDKWTPKEILTHLIDHERITSYRALRIAREEKAELSGYDQDKLIKNSNANERSIEDLVNDFSIARNSNIALFKSFTEGMAMKKGSVNNFIVTPLGLGFVIIGHCIHHMNIIKGRYL